MQMKRTSILIIILMALAFLGVGCEEAEDITEKVEELKGTVEKIVEEAGEKVSEVEQQLATATEKAKEVKEKVEEIKEKVEDILPTTTPTSTEEPDASRSTVSTPSYPDSPVVEGEETGFFFRGTTECLSAEANPFESDIVYVSPDGSDENDGASASSPLKTIKRALCNAGPGLTIKVLAGTYSESVFLVYFGDVSSPITISGDMSNGKRPVLDGDHFFTMGLALVQSENIIIENLEFTNYTDEGVMISLSSSIVLRNNIFTHNGANSVDPDHGSEGFGLQVTESSDITIEDNTFSNNGPGPELRAKSFMGTGIDTYGIKDSVIRGNTSSNNVGGGILVEDGVNVIVENNTIEENDLDASADGWWDAGIWIDGGHDITIRNNTIRNNLGPGIEVSDSDLQYYKYPDATRGYVIRDNTIEGNYWALYTFNFGQCPLPPAEILIWENNTVDGNTYDGDLVEEFEYHPEQQSLCTTWPCGEMTPCSSDHE